VHEIDKWQSNVRDHSGSIMMGASCLAGLHASLAGLQALQNQNVSLSIVAPKQDVAGSKML